MSWRPAPTPLSTGWAQDVDPVAPLPEYPRPQLVRDEWLNLNGLWEWAVAKATDPRPRFDGARILVPFAIESSLSGVGRRLGRGERLWYRRRVRLPGEWQGRRVRLHFGAVDWECEVWWNDVRLGAHRGGFLPFSFEVADASAGQPDNELVVAVRDPTSRGRQQRGKQSSRPRLVFYTPVSGIWQTVWLEPVPQRFVADLRLTPGIDPPTLRIDARLAGPGTGGSLLAHARDGERILAEARAPAGQEMVLDLPGAELWSPEHPKLYDLDVCLESEDGDPGEVDRVRSYFGLRSFGVAPDAHGVPRLCLNGEPRFQLGVLDQGWWPDGLYTAPTDAALLHDVQSIKALGFDMVRKHVKVEPARWYHHCDRLGLVVWQDMPNGGRIGAGFVLAWLAHLAGMRIRDDRGWARFGRATRAAREDFRRELRELIEALVSVPCVGGWVPFNEGWGQFDSRDVAEEIRRLDPTRPVEAASGWFDQGAGDLLGLHRYVGPDMPAPEPGRAVGLSEFGGLGLRVEGHVFHPRRRFVYRMLDSPEALTRAYLACLERLAPLIERGLSLSVYTQLSDVEIELNGLLSYDRAVCKLDRERVARAHAELARFAAGCSTPGALASSTGDVLRLRRRGT